LRHEHIIGIFSSHEILKGVAVDRKNMGKWEISQNRDAGGTFVVK